MANTKTGPREYRPLALTGAVLIKPKVYQGTNEGWTMEPVDFSEAGNYLGYRFDPRSLYAISAPKGAIRGGHLESRSKLVTILTGAVFYVLVDMRPGENQGNAISFYLGESEEAWGKSVLVPEGVIDAWVPVTEKMMYVSVGDHPYNAFDSLVTLNLFDPKLGVKWPMGSQPHHDTEHRPNHQILDVSQFIESLK